MRDQAIAPRFDSRPAWWIFREILRRMGVKEALDFETIEELWELPARGHRGHRRRDARGWVRPLAESRSRPPCDGLEFPTPSGKIEIESEALKKAGLPSLPPYEPKAAPAGDRLHLLSPTPRRWRTASPSTTRSCGDRAGTGALDPPRPRPAAGDRRRGRGRGSSATTSPVRRKDQGEGGLPWIHPDAVFMLHGYGATVPLANACPRRRPGRPAPIPAARQAPRVRPGRRSMCPDRDRRPGQARRGGRRPMSASTLPPRRGELHRVPGLEVHCKTNKDLQPRPGPVQDPHRRSD